MSNLLKMAVSESIRTLHRRGWSQRRIAAELGINRETVARYLRLAEPLSKPAIAPIGSATADDAPRPAIAPIGSPTADDAPRPAIAPIGSQDRRGMAELAVATCAAIASPQLRGSGRPSACEPWREIIQTKCESGFNAQRIYQDLCTEHGFGGSDYAVRRFVRSLEAKHQLPLRRIECAPGDEAQIDFGIEVRGSQLVRLASLRLRAGSQAVGFGGSAWHCP